MYHINKSISHKVHPFPVLNCVLGCCSQFPLLVELFQDGEKAVSPTGQAQGAGGRTRLSIKPDKGRTSSREHKKTVGCQVRSLGRHGGPETQSIVPLYGYQRRSSIQGLL